jgi:hypothetical protein
LKATFSRFPDMPHGLEIPYAGMVTAINGSSSLVLSGGFCGGNDAGRKPAGNVYSRGFFNTTFALPLELVAGHGPGYATLETNSLAIHRPINI